MIEFGYAALIRWSVHMCSFGFKKPRPLLLSDHIAVSAIFFCGNWSGNDGLGVFAAAQMNNCILLWASLISFHDIEWIEWGKIGHTVVYNCFLWKVVRQSHTDVTSFCMQFEKIGRGLLRQAFRSEGECFFSRKRVGEYNKEVYLLDERDLWLKFILGPMVLFLTRNFLFQSQVGHSSNR